MPTPAHAYELLTRVPARRTALIAALACVLFMAAAALPNAGLLDSDQVGDTPQYRTRGDAVLAGEIPYRDFYVEYPPGALPMFVVPAIGDADGYATRFKLLALALGIATIALVAFSLRALGSGEPRLLGATAFVALVPAALGPVVLVNFDLWPAFLTAAALAALLHGRFRLGHAVLGAAVAAKVYPLVLLPLAYLHVRRTAGPRTAFVALGVFAAALAVVVLPFLVLGPGGVRFSLEVALRRPLQIESLGASLLLVAHQLGVYDPSVNSDFNSQNLGGSLPGTLAILSSVLVLVALAAVWRAFGSRAGSLHALVLAAAAAVAGAVAFGKVLSPQFLVWLIPLIPLAGGRRGIAAAALLGGALLLTQVWFPTRYGDVVGLEAIGWVVLARNLVLVTLFFVLASGLRRPARDAAERAPGRRRIHG